MTSYDHWKTNEPDDQHPYEREDEEIRKAFEAKDAEIERLKALVLPKIAEAGQWLELNEALTDQRKLITELADALKKANPTERYNALLQRARDAVK